MITWSLSQKRKVDLTYKSSNVGNFPGNPKLKIPCSQCRGAALTPDWRTKILYIPPRGKRSSHVIRK